MLCCIFLLEKVEPLKRDIALAYLAFISSSAHSQVAGQPCPLLAGVLWMMWGEIKTMIPTNANSDGVEMAYFHWSTWLYLSCTYLLTVTFATAQY